MDSSIIIKRDRVKSTGDVSTKGRSIAWRRAFHDMTWLCNAVACGHVNAFFWAHSHAFRREEWTLKGNST